MKQYNVLTIYTIVVAALEFSTSVVGSSFPGGGAYQWSTTATDVSSNAAAAASVRRTQTTVRRRPRISPSKFFGSLAAHGSCRPRVTANDAVTAAAADHAVSAAERSAAARTTATSSTAAPHAAIKSRVRTAFYALLTSRPAVPRSVIRAFARSFRVSERSLYALLPPPLRHVLLGYNAGDSSAVVTNVTKSVTQPSTTVVMAGTPTATPQQAAELSNSVWSAADDRSLADGQLVTTGSPPADGQLITTGSPPAVSDPNVSPGPRPEQAPAADLTVRRVAVPSTPVSPEKLMSLFVPWWAAPSPAFVTPASLEFPKLFRMAGTP